MDIKASEANWFFSYGLSQQQVAHLCWFNDKNLQERVSIAQIYSSLCNGENQQADIDEVIIKQEIDNNHIEYIIKKPLRIYSRRDDTWKNELVFNLSLVDNLNNLIVDYFNNKYGWEGKNFTTKFKERVIIDCNFEPELKIQNCIFDKGLEISSNVEINFAKGVVFKNCEFNGKVLFKNAVFGSKEQMEFVNVNFKDCKFKDEVNFSNCKFYGNVYFNNSTFEGYADFHESEFNKTACFYGATFEKTPNFSQVIFKGNLNLVNSNLKFDFNKCNDTIEKELKRQQNKNHEITSNKIANDFRDSFRIFKNALIKENNLLDASNYHKIELYFKEIELKAKKPLKFSKEWIDLWQLRLYRLTSNHHTNLLKIWNNFVILVGIFSLLTLGTIILCDKVASEIVYWNFFAYKISPTLLTINIIILAIFIGLCAISIFGKICLNFIIIWILSIFIPQYFFMNGYMLIFAFLFIVIGFLFYFKKFAISISYISLFLLLFINPKYLISVVNIFSHKNCLFDPLMTISALYSILSIILLFSLQKTARKNSIIPA